MAIASRCFMAVVAFTVFLPQCKKEQRSDNTRLRPLDRYTYQQAMMGTRFFITLYAENKKEADIAAAAAFRYASDVNSACSDYDVTSELMKLNTAPHHQPISLSPLLYDVLSRAIIIARQTKGAHDPTLGHHSYNWRMARKKGVLTPPEKITQAIAASGWAKLQLDPKLKTATKLVPNMRLDLGGIAKGYAADGMLDTLNKHGTPKASVTAGGEVRLGDSPPNQAGWKVTLKTLDTKNQLSPATIVLSNCAVSTSGDLYQTITIEGVKYSHIVDPSTGLGLSTQVSATIIAKNATLTDALATAYCVNPSLNYPGVKTFVIFRQPDGSLKCLRSTDWPPLQ